MRGLGFGFGFRVQGVTTPVTPYGWLGRVCTGFKI